jgi:hypothetical protein
MIWSKKPSHATVPLKQPSFKIGSTQTTTFPLLFFKSLCLGTLIEETIYMLQEENTRRAFCKPKTQRARLNNVVLEQSSREREEGREYGNRADKG